MAEVFDTIFGGGRRKAADEANKAALETQQSQQRRSLAQMAEERGRTTQAGAYRSGSGRGRSMLTFLSGAGRRSLG